MNGLNVLTVEKQCGDEARLKQNLDTDLAVQLRSLGVVLAERVNETKRTVDTLCVLGMVSLIAVPGMIVPAMMIKHCIISIIACKINIIKQISNIKNMKKAA